MDELYIELTLEKVERKLLGEETLQSYENMFSCNKSEHKNRKILMKADPGHGEYHPGEKDYERLDHRGVQKSFQSYFL